jgi:23S rRNA (cytosine1962-C5)-methyltransferase
MFKVELKRSHAVPVAAGHPWVFAQAVAQLHGRPEAGDEVVVVDPFGKAHGRGYWSPSSAIVVRILTSDPERALDGTFFRERLVAAKATRALLGLPNAETTGYRLVHAEGDGLAGLIVDVYGDVLVVQLLTAGMQRRKSEVVLALVDVMAPRAIYEEASPQVLAREGITSEGGLLYGQDAPALVFRERGLSFSLPREGSQKTGYFFDQREHRSEVERLSAGREVLDACCYVGGFALGAARGGAKSVLALDSSQPALNAGQSLAEQNGLSQIRFQKADVREELERMAIAGERYDLVVFDPPKLVPTVKHLEKGRRAYRRFNRFAIELVRPGGVLVTCSCSAGMDETEFVRMLAFASKDAGRELSVLRVGKQAPDHPVPPGFGEGSYLKTVFAVVR